MCKVLHLMLACNVENNELHIKLQLHIKTIKLIVLTWVVLGNSTIISHCTTVHLTFTSPGHTSLNVHSNARERV